MPIDSESAARIAAEHGLGLSDASALARMSDDEDQAHRLAAQFAPVPSSGPDSAMNRLIRNAALGPKQRGLSRFRGGK